MIADKIFLDIETLKTERRDVIEYIAAGVKPPAAMKKPETLEKWQLEERPVALAEAWSKTALDGSFGRIASIAWAIGDGPIVTAHTAVDGQHSEDQERKLLSGFFASLQRTCDRLGYPPVIVGHNVGSFDVRWLWKRGVILDVPAPEWWPVDSRPWDRDRVFDTMLAWEGVGGRISLDRLCLALNIPGKDGLDGSLVGQAWDEGRFDAIAQYCGEDVERVRRIWKRITGYAPAAADAEPACADVAPIVSVETPSPAPRRPAVGFRPGARPAASA